MKSSAKNIGANIRTIRMEQSMTQDELAEALFVTRQTVSNYETGRSNPDVEKLIAIAQILHTDLDTLIYGKQPTPDRRADRKRLLCTCAFAAGSVLLYYLAHHLFVLVEQGYYFMMMPWRMYRMAADPILWGSVGWMAVELIHYFFHIQPVKPEIAHKFRRILWGFTISYVILMLPMFCFYGYCCIKMMLQHDLHESMNIPIYNQMIAVLYPLFYRYPAILTPFGCAFRLFSREPAVQEKKTETEG